MGLGRWACVTKRNFAGNCVWVTAGNVRRLRGRRPWSCSASCDCEDVIDAPSEVGSRKSLSSHVFASGR